MLTGHVKVNEFQIIDFQGEWIADAGGETIYECKVAGRDNCGSLFEHDFQVIDPGVTGAGLVALIMAELDRRLTS